MAKSDHDDVNKPPSAHWNSEKSYMQASKGEKKLWFMLFISPPHSTCFSLLPPTITPATVQKGVPGDWFGGKVSI